MLKLNKSPFQQILGQQPKIFKYWFIITFILGVGLVLIIPPFQSPDEFNHFYRIYQITDGKLLSEFNSDSSQLGGYVPKSLIDISKPFYELTSLDNHRSLRIDTFEKYWNLPLNRKETMFFPFQNTARYAFTAYLPQIISFIVLKKTDVNPLKMMYAGRLINFLAWFFLVSLAVLVTPVFKELFMIFLFLPASMSINSTLNADVFTNAMVFLLFALFFRFRQATKIKNSELILFGALIFLTTFNKIVYFPILFLLLMVPQRNFQFSSLKPIFILMSTGLCVGIIFWWSKIINTLIYPDITNLNRTTYQNMHQGVIINPALQLKHILQNPFNSILQLIEQSGIILTTRTPSSWIASFGWDGYVPSGLGLAIMFVLVLWASTQRNSFELKTLDRFLFFILGFGMTMLFILSQHLHWDAVGDFYDSGYLGKYFIPIFPFYFWAIAGVFADLKIRFLKTKILNVAVIICFSIIYLDFGILIYQHYYS